MTDVAAPDSNAQAYSVSELAFALKRTLEDRYSFVRLRGELSKVTRHANGHVYLTVKDDKAAIDGVVWKGHVRPLQVPARARAGGDRHRQDHHLPGRSRYQIVIETMEAGRRRRPAGPTRALEGQAARRGPVLADRESAPCPPCQR